MNKKQRILRYAIILGISGFLVIASAAPGYSFAEEHGSGYPALYIQATDTPQTQGLSEIGSTDGIVVLGFLIVLIIIVPILLNRKSWTQAS